MRTPADQRRGEDAVEEECVAQLGGKVNPREQRDGQQHGLEPTYCEGRWLGKGGGEASKASRRQQHSMQPRDRPVLHEEHVKVAWDRVTGQTVEPPRHGFAFLKARECVCFCVEDISPVLHVDDGGVGGVQP